MNTIGRLILYLLVVLNLGSCVNLDEKVYSSITESSYQYSPGDATKAIGAIYANLRTYYSYANRTQEICTDEIVMPANTAGGWDDGGIYRRMHLHEWNSEQSFILNFWQNQYQGIILSNRILNQLYNNDIPLSPSEDMDELIAEIRALRAFHYWMVVDNWAEAPLLTKPTTDLPENSTRKEIFDFVVSELNEIIEKLPSENLINGHFNKWAAHALLANIYLNAEVYIGESKWNECIKECDAILNSNKYQLDVDYRTPFSTNNEISLENIWVIPYDEINGKGFTYYLDALHKANKETFDLESTPYGSGAYKGVPQFIATYDKDDDRLDATWLSGPQYGANGEPCIGYQDLANQPLVYDNIMRDGIQVGEGEGFRWLKYEIKQGAKTNLNNDFVVFRLAQIYMMKAEALLRTGRSEDAALLVTQVRSRAFKNNPEKAKVSGEDLLKPSLYQYGVVSNYILTPQKELLPSKYGRFYDELGWEFAGELMRRRDMIRFGTFTKAQWLSHNKSDEYRTVFPIPQRVLDANPNINQTENY